MGASKRRARAEGGNFFLKPLSYCPSNVPQICASHFRQLFCQESLRNVLSFFFILRDFRLEGIIDKLYTKGCLLLFLPCQFTKPSII